MFYLFVVCLSLSALLTVNALASLGAEALWRAIRLATRRWLARTRAHAIFMLRIFPLVGALICVAVVILPSYLTYEPWPPDEIVTTKLVAITLLSAAGIGLAIWRGIDSWRGTQRLVTEWLRHAEAIHLEGAPIPAYRIRHPFPVIAVVGVIRPQLFIASQIFDSLSPDEIKAAIRHEVGHLEMRDNLKRVLMRACRDVLMIVPCGRILDRDWYETAEAAADEYASCAGAAIALDLASALVKIARMIPQGVRPVMPAGAFLINDEVDGVAWRVRRLTQLAETNKAGEVHSAALTRLVLHTCPCLLVVGLASMAASPAVLARLHAVLERVFWLLS